MPSFECNHDLHTVRLILTELYPWFPPLVVIVAALVVGSLVAYIVHLRRELYWISDPRKN